MSRRTRIYSLTALSVVVALVVGSIAAFQRFGSHAAAKSGGLSKHDHELLATAIAKGDKTVTLLIASKKGANNTVANGVASLGGTVRYREDDVDYIRATVPTD